MRGLECGFHLYYLEYRITSDTAVAKSNTMLLTFDHPSSEMQSEMQDVT